MSPDAVPVDTGVSRLSRMWFLLLPALPAPPALSVKGGRLLTLISVEALLLIAAAAAAADRSPLPVAA